MAQALEERADYIDVVAQAVIDKIEEHSRLARLVEMVAARVMEMQKQEATLKQVAGESTQTKTREDADNGNES